MNNRFTAEKQTLKKYYSSFLETGIPTFILDDIKRWIFFLQEGICFEYAWDYNTELSTNNKKQLYHLLQKVISEGAEAPLFDELKKKLKF